MCAINGITTSNTDLVSRMNAITAHRGPDFNGLWTSEGITLGHCRLKIIDLDDRSNQPMISIDGRYIIVFNGEIYNYRELRKKLDYPFKTTSDTEVLLAGFINRGPEILNDLEGIFAFCIWDTKTRSLFLARDHNGIKPLYYAIDSSKNLIFSSELKAVLEHNIDRILNPVAFHHYLHLLYTPGPMTAIAGINKLPPAHFGVFKEGKILLTRYWEVQKSNTVSGKFTAGGIKRLIQNTVKEELISDRPLGVYLSGGIDSSAILSSALKVHPHIDTFSVGFKLSKDEQPEKFNADQLLAKKTADKFGTRHHEFNIDASIIPDALENIVWHLDEPVANATVIPMFLLAEYAKQHVAVVLSGDGGDELFGGYERYRFSKIASLFQRSHFPSFLLPSNIRGKLQIPPGVSRYAFFMSRPEQTINDLLSRSIEKNETQNFLQEMYFQNITQDFENQFMEVDRQTWLVDEALHRTDRMSMAHGLEVRVPLLNKHIIAAARSFPSIAHVDPFRTKKILRTAFAQEIPSHILHAPKRGWFSPTAKWLRTNELKIFVSEILSPGYNAVTAPLFNWDNIHKFVSAHENQTHYYAHEIWQLLIFQIWARKFRIKL